MANRVGEFAAPDLAPDLVRDIVNQTDENYEQLVKMDPEWQAAIDEYETMQNEGKGGNTHWTNNYRMNAGLGTVQPGPEHIGVTFPKAPQGPEPVPFDAGKQLMEWIDNSMPDRLPFSTSVAPVLPDSAGVAKFGAEVGAKLLDMFVLDPVAKFGEAKELFSSGQTPSDMPLEASQRAVGALLETGVGVGTGAAFSQAVAPVKGTYLGMFGGRGITGTHPDAQFMRDLMIDADLRLDDLLRANKDMTPEKALRKINKELSHLFPEDIVKKLEIGADGHIRFEFSDQALRFKYDWKKLDNETPYLLEQIIDHSVLKKYFPDALLGYKVAFRKVNPKNIKNWNEWNGGSGYIDFDNKLIFVEATNDKEAMGVILHELQHRMQQMNDFSHGSNKEAAGELKIWMYNDLALKINDLIQSGYKENKETIERLQKIQTELSKLSDDEIYRRVAGENEAEAVRVRKELTLGERKEIHSKFNEPRAREKQIVTYDGRRPMSEMAKDNGWYGSKPGNDNTPLKPSDTDFLTDMIRIIDLAEDTPALTKILQDLHDMYRTSSGKKADDIRELRYKVEEKLERNSAKWIKEIDRLATELGGGYTKAVVKQQNKPKLVSKNDKETTGTGKKPDLKVAGGRDLDMNELEKAPEVEEYAKSVRLGIIASRIETLEEYLGIGGVPEKLMKQYEAELKQLKKEQFKLENKVIKGDKDNE